MQDINELHSRIETADPAPTKQAQPAIIAKSPTMQKTLQHRSNCAAVGNSADSGTNRRRQGIDCTRHTCDERPLQ